MPRRESGAETAQHPHPRQEPDDMPDLFRDRRHLRRSSCRLSFFFSSRRRHTRFDCDWSSDVCSSDLKESTGAKKKKQQKSEQEFLDQYRAAYALKLAGDYQAAFAAFKALDADDHPDVATELGYLARKLGDYQLSKYWYEHALVLDPQHVKTWQYYGMWQVEQGNMLKAADFLQKIEAICGNRTCKEYQDLKGGMEGTVTY